MELSGQSEGSAILREMIHFNRRAYAGWALAICTVFVAMPVRGDDSAAAVGAGGLVARRETRVAMAKEVLKISPSKVVVDYDFWNDTDEDVTTEVAFPIPPYEHGPDEWPAEKTSFSDFRLTVDGEPVKYQAESRAFLKGKEITGVLNADRIDIATFGHYDWKKDRAPEFARLPNAEQSRLVKLGLFDSDEPWGNWTVHLQYHWTQVFPAKSTVHIRHEYTPIQGFEMMPRATIRKALHEPLLAGDPEVDATYGAEDAKLLGSFCPEPRFLKSLERSMTSAQVEDAAYGHPHWVDFILTSANTWKQPIKDFTLTVEREAQRAGESRTMVSFCSPERAEVQKIDAEHFQVHLTNLVPKAELRIGFFDVPDVKAANSSSVK